MVEAVRGDLTVGLIADPDLPEQVASYLADQVPRHRDGQEWSVEVVVDPVTAGRQSVEEILETSKEHRRRHGWDYAICLTDLPLRDERRPVMAEVNVGEYVGLISLPALGATQPYRRAQQVLQRLLDDFTTRVGQENDARLTPYRSGLNSPLTELLAPIRRDGPAEHDQVTVRYLATKTRGRVRLLAGMVRTNRPWRLIFGLAGALAAALASSAFGLSSSTIWQIADRLGTTRQVVAALASIVLLVTWLIAAHHLWETSNRDSSHDREQVLFYNLSTVLTLTIGVGCMYVGLLVVTLPVASFLVPPTLLVSVLGHPADWPTYATLAWGFTTMGVVAGALGSSLESEEAVRQAAYGYREKQRRAQRAKQREY